MRTRDGAVGCGTALQAERSRVRFPMCHWNFSLLYSFRAQYGHGVDSAYNRNEYQEYFLEVKGCRCIGPATLPPSSADYL